MTPTKVSLILSFFSMLLMASCRSRPEGSRSNVFLREVRIRVDSAYNRVDTDASYLACRGRALRLGLPDLWNGTRGIEIRIWVGGGITLNEGMLRLRYDEKSWTATSYAMVVYSSEQSWSRLPVVDTVYFRKELLQPRDGWKDFITRLLSMQVMTLPDERDVPACRQLRSPYDAGGISFEIATPYMYRVYSYRPAPWRCKCWQGRAVDSISALLYREFPERHSSTEWAYVDIPRKARN